MKNDNFILGDVLLFISPDRPLCKQLSALVGKMVTMADFEKVDYNDFFVTLRHLDSELMVSYISEEKVLNMILERK